MTSFGLGYEVDLMLCLDNFDQKLGVGIMYAGHALFGAEQEGGFDIGIYGLELYGVKGQYRFWGPDNAVSPYVSLGLGVSKFSTPEITSGTTVIEEGKSAFSFRLRPEIGIDLGGFVISAAYMTPMSYTIESDMGDYDGSAGAFTISIGYRKYIDISNLF